MANGIGDALISIGGGLMARTQQEEADKAAYKKLMLAEQMRAQREKLAADAKAASEEIKAKQKDKDRVRNETLQWGMLAEREKNTNARADARNEIAKSKKADGSGTGGFRDTVIDPVTGQPTRYLYDAAGNVVRPLGAAPNAAAMDAANATSARAIDQQVLTAQAKADAEIGKIRAGINEQFSTPAEKRKAAATIKAIEDSTKTQIDGLKAMREGLSKKPTTAQKASQESVGLLGMLGGIANGFSQGLATGGREDAAVAAAGEGRISPNMAAAGIAQSSGNPTTVLGSDVQRPTSLLGTGMKANEEKAAPSKQEIFAGYVAQAKTVRPDLTEAQIKAWLKTQGITP